MSDLRPIKMMTMYRDNSEYFQGIQWVVSWVREEGAPREVRFCTRVDALTFTEGIARMGKNEGGG